MTSARCFACQSNGPVLSGIFQKQPVLAYNVVFQHEIAQPVCWALSSLFLLYSWLYTAVFLCCCSSCTDLNSLTAVHSWIYSFTSLCSPYFISKETQPSAEAKYTQRNSTDVLHCKNICVFIYLFYLIVNSKNIAPLIFTCFTFRSRRGIFM